MSIARLHETIPCFDETVPCFIEMVPCLMKQYPVSLNGTLFWWNGTCFDEMVPCLNEMLPWLDEMVPCLDETICCFNKAVPCFDETVPCFKATVLTWLQETMETFLLEIRNYTIQCSYFLKKEQKVGNWYFCFWSVYSNKIYKCSHCWHRKRYPVATWENSLCGNPPCLMTMVAPDQMTPGS